MMNNNDLLVHAPGLITGTVYRMRFHNAFHNFHVGISGAAAPPLSLFSHSRDTCQW